MKKSQLRNIIRESIKELITEQSPTPPPNPGAMLSSYSSFAAGGLQSINDLNSRMPQIRSYIINNIFLHQGPNGGYPFNSSNTDQPCNYLSNKIDNLQNFLANPTNWCVNNPPCMSEKQFRLDLFIEILAWVQSHPPLTGSSAYPWSC